VNAWRFYQKHKVYDTSRNIGNNIGFYAEGGAYRNGYFHAVKALADYDPIQWLSAA
jgi:hypothetical protein